MSNPKFPLIIYNSQRPKYHGNNGREISPRNNHIERLRRRRTIKDIITELIINYKQEYTVLPAVGRNMKCSSFFKTLLENADNDFHNLPRTIIYTSSYLQAQRLAVHLEEKCGIPCGVGSSNDTKAELLPMFQQCYDKEIPILIFESREFKERVDNVDLVINFSLPSTIEEYARRLDSLVHKKCLTFVTCDEDRQFLRKIFDIVEAKGCVPPRSLTEVFTLYGGNFERYIKEFQVKDSWID
jgi:superfamily II DNA/RNA helicase